MFILVLLIIVLVILICIAYKLYNYALNPNSSKKEYLIVIIKMNLEKKIFGLMILMIKAVST
ncbi:hypothetical protein L0P85_09690 [Terrisporobacter glycolicus]|nr:hypothetical protein L0P85_09690 [Terrisporobacter glycolicus]